MTATAEPAGNTEVADEEWRGVAAEELEEIGRGLGVRLQARSRRLLGSLVRPHRWRIALALLVVVLENVALLGGPVLIAAGLDHGVPSALRGEFGPLIWCVAGYLACGVTAAGAHAGFVRWSALIGQDVMLDLRARIFAQAQRLSLSFHERYTSGKVISRLTSDLDSLSDLVEEGMDSLISAVLTVVGVSVAMFVLDVPLALVMLAGFAPAVWLLRWFYRRSHRNYRATRGAIATVIVHFVESMNGIRAVQAFRREPRNDELLAGLNDRYREANRQALAVVAWFTSGLRGIGNLSLAVVLAIGAVRVAHGGLELGVLAAFALYLRRFYDPLDDLAMFANTYSSASAALEKISGLLDEEPAVADPQRPRPLPAPRGEVVFRRVSFRYGPDTPRVLEPFDLTVPAGQTVALVGATGAGKSTLAKLVARFYDPSEGAVELDGVDLRSVADAELRTRVAMVTQENFLFAGTVADNIALGRPGASRAEIESAAAAVGAHEFIAGLPEGYDTDVRKRGGRLSAGQRQLVAFARALLADPAVLVLDEATASLDVPTEHAVQAALATVLADRTALIIAHRLSTVLIAERVLVIDAGAIVEDGSPRTLAGTGGRFAALYRAWRDSLT